jgi:hypothetical protein
VDEVTHRRTKEIRLPFSGDVVGWIGEWSDEGFEDTWDSWGLDGEILANGTHRPWAEYTILKNAMMVTLQDAAEVDAKGNFVQPKGSLLASTARIREIGEALNRVLVRLALTVSVETDK